MEADRKSSALDSKRSFIFCLYCFTVRVQAECPDAWGMMSAFTVLDHAKLIKQLHKRFGNLSGLSTVMVKSCSYSLPLVRTRGPCSLKGWLLSFRRLSFKAPGGTWPFGS